MNNLYSLHHAIDYRYNSGFGVLIGTRTSLLSQDKSLIRFGFVITLGVFCDNHSAVECYKSVGFRITGTDAYSIDGEEWK